MNTLVYSIETSCDETSVAILNDKKEILSHITINQKDHNKFGGVVPEIASRAHLQILQTIIPKSFKEAKISINDIDIFCATCGPGLIGGLLVGLSFAKTLAQAKKIPFIAVNHLAGHALTVRLTNNIDFPYLLLLISGGHSSFYYLKNLNQYIYLGGTLDDAVGEAFDKIGKVLGLKFPGGPELEKIALNGYEDAFQV